MSEAAGAPRTDAASGARTLHAPQALFDVHPPTVTLNSEPLFVGAYQLVDEVINLCLTHNFLLVLIPHSELLFVRVRMLSSG